jgi:hypothetical protein
MIQVTDGRGSDQAGIQFISKSVDGNDAMEHRRPDAILALKAGDIPGHDGDRLLLSREQLEKQMNDRRCGLVVSGVWGETRCAFPFAVYEAKKKYMSELEAKEQGFRAAAHLLSLLDDLARDPANLKQYQFPGNHVGQMFVFTSCGPMATIYAAWYRGLKCVSLFLLSVRSRSSSAMSSSSS